jgi:hypothetical protein
MYRKVKRLGIVMEISSKLTFQLIGFFRTASGPEQNFTERGYVLTYLRKTIYMILLTYNTTCRVIKGGMDRSTYDPESVTRPGAEGLHVPPAGALPGPPWHKPSVIRRQPQVFTCVGEARPSDLLLDVVKDPEVLIPCIFDRPWIGNDHRHFATSTIGNRYRAWARVSCDSPFNSSSIEDDIIYCGNGNIKNTCQESLIEYNGIKPVPGLPESRGELFEITRLTERCWTP